MVLKKSCNVNRPSGNEKHLNLGCGSENIKGYINTDKTKHPKRKNGDIMHNDNINIILDLDHPLPFKSNSIDGIRLRGVMAHVSHPIKLRRELNRILKPGGSVEMIACSCEENSRFNIDGHFEKIVGFSDIEVT